MEETPASRIWCNSSQPCMTSLDECMRARIMQAHSFYLGIDDFVLRIGKEGLNNVCVMKNRGWLYLCSVSTIRGYKATTWTPVTTIKLNLPTTLQNQHATTICKYLLKITTNQTSTKTQKLKLYKFLLKTSKVVELFIFNGFIQMHETNVFRFKRFRIFPATKSIRSSASLECRCPHPSSQQPENVIHNVYGAFAVDKN